MRRRRTDQAEPDLRLQRRAISSIIFTSRNASQRLPLSKTAPLVDRARNLSGAKLLIEDSRTSRAPRRGASGFRETTMTVRAILDTKGHQILSVEPDAKLSAAVKLLGERKIGAVLVMNQGRLEGILSERDIVRVLGERGARVLDEPVSSVMTRKVVSCRQSDTVSGIMEMMTLGKFRHLPVVEDSKVVGLISIGDIVKRRVHEYETEQEALRDYIKTA
jgi:CBS domain-containing protein